MRLGLIGCGALGTKIAKGAVSKDFGGFTLVGVMDTAESGRAEVLAKQVGCRSFTNVHDLLCEGPEIVVEAASREAVWAFSADCIDAGASLILCSSGALLDNAFRQKLLSAARFARKKVYVPSGALGGLDAAHAAGLTGAVTATLVSRKPPSALQSAPHMLDRDVTAITTPETVFSGTPEEGVAEFPQNVNVAASLCLALGESGNLHISVVADPTVHANVHSWDIEGPFGSATFEIRARPTDENQRSSEIAAYSVLALLKRIEGPLEIG